MAVIEPQKEPRSFAPVILTVVVLLIVGGLAYGIYAMMRGPTSRTITLSTTDAKKQTGSGLMSAVPPGPAFPVMPPMPQETDPGPAMISVDLKNATVAQVAEELSKQAGININPGGGQPNGIIANLMQKRFDYKVDNQPFWEAMKELAKQGQVSPNMNDYNYNNQRSEGITLMQGSSFQWNGPQQEIGSCLLILNSVTSRFYADIMNNRSANRSLVVSLNLCVEPKLKPYRITPVATIMEARDENGTSLIKPKDPWADRNGGGQRSKYMSNVNCILNFANNAGQKIAKLKGYCSVIVAGPEQTVTIKDPLTKTNLDTKIDQQTVRLVNIRKMGDNNYEASFKADATSPVFKDWEIFSKVAKLVDANGKAFNHGGGGWGGGSATAMDFSIYFNGDPTMSQPTEMTITLPTNLREIRVPFDYTDLPLPH